jgi:hypothetical protein
MPCIILVKYNAVPLLQEKPFFTMRREYRSFPFTRKEDSSKASAPSFFAREIGVNAPV